jgi:ferritin
MLHERMEEALNRQINAELFSAYLYLSMSASFAALGLPGGANWMRVQAQEELFHASKFYDYVIERNGHVALQAIDEPPRDWTTPISMFEDALEHEQKVTGLIYDLTDLSVELRDHATNNILQWFIAEQVEEEASADEMVQRLRLAAGSPGALFQIDSEMAGRVYTPPAAEA